MINLFKLILLLIVYCNQAYSDELVNLRFGSNEEKLHGLKQIEDQINTIRENQQKAIRIVGDEESAMRRYKCLFP